MEAESKRDLSNIHIEPLRSTHERGGFCCSVKVIENYCRFNIRKQHDAYQVRAYVALDGDSQNLVGFYYLCLTSITIGVEDGPSLDDASESKFSRVHAVPAVYLGMIASKEEYRGSGLGAVLMAHAIGTTSEIAERAGTYALTLDALNEKLVEYYKEFGFQTFKQSKTGLEMFMPIQTLMRAVQRPTEA